MLCSQRMIGVATTGPTPSSPAPPAPSAATSATRASRATDCSTNTSRGRNRMPAARARCRLRHARHAQPAGATSLRIAATESLYFSNSGDVVTAMTGGGGADESVGGGGAPLPRILRSAQSIT